MLENKLRARRIHLGLTQQSVADATGLTRQSIHAMESHARSPSVDVALKLAGILQTTVERLFGDEPETRFVKTRAALARRVGPTKRVRLAQVDGRWHRYPLTPEGAATRAADGIVRDADDDEVELLRPKHELEDTLVVMGCAPALAILADHAGRGEANARIMWAKASSTAALQALAHAQTHVAGVHLVDKRTRSHNVADVKKLTRGLPTTLFTLGWWDVGFVLPKGNPLHIRNGSHLARANVRFALREEGSGARRLLDAELARAGAKLGKGPHVHVDGHIEVARAVAQGVADVGVATADAALAFDLAFVPLDHERYDLAIPDKYLREPRVVRMLDTLATSTFRRDIASLGYETTKTGALAE